MSHLAVTILFALCISQYANAAAVSNNPSDVGDLKRGVETALNTLRTYAEKYLYELVDVQDTAAEEFEKGLKKEINAAIIEIKNAAKKKGNSAKINQCVETGRGNIDKLTQNSSKNVENCIESQNEEEVNQYFDKLVDEISAGKAIQGLIENLEKSAESCNGRVSNVEKKILNIRASLTRLEDAARELIENGDKVMKNIKIQSKECNNEHLANVNSSVAVHKVNAFRCIEKA